VYVTETVEQVTLKVGGGAGHHDVPGADVDPIVEEREVGTGGNATGRGAGVATGGDVLERSADAGEGSDVGN
jgi:hypothetical protein